MKIIIAIINIMVLTVAVAAHAQTPVYQFTDGRDLTLCGRSRLVRSGYYHRIDSADLPPLPKSVQRLASNASGLNLVFKTNSKSIQIKMTLGRYQTLKNMTPIAIDGVDLYGWNGHAWQYVAAGAPAVQSDSLTLIRNMDGNMRYYKLYLPLYAELKSIAVGIENTATITAVDSSFLPKKKIVIYGSSITQGASASRPGMAYPSIISRNLNVEIFNMGFSGSGKIEPELADVIANMPADLYILDCVPNPGPDEIKSRTVPFIHKLRSLKPGVPILMVESVFREGANWDAKANANVTAQNYNFQKAYDELKSEHFESLYYVKSADLMGTDHEATIDGTHLTDLGQTRIAQTIGKAITQILK